MNLLKGLLSQKAEPRMGDVKRSDLKSGLGLLPTMQQGYATPEEQALAEVVQQRNQRLAIAGQDMPNAGPEDVRREQLALDAGQMSGGVKKTISNNITDLATAMANKKIKTGMEHIPEHMSEAGKWKDIEFNYRLNSIEEPPLVAIRDGKVVGHLGIDNDNIVRASYVNPEYRGQGISTELYEKALRERGEIISDSAREPGDEAVWKKLSKKYPVTTIKSHEGTHYKIVLPKKIKK